MNIAIVSTNSAAAGTPALFDDGNRKSLRLDGYTDIAVNAIDAAHDYERVRLGMERITDDVSLHEAFPWRTFELDAYGKMYRQEVGLSPPDASKDDRKFRFQFTPEMVPDVPPDALDVPEVRRMLQALGRIEARACTIAHAALESYDTENTGGREYRGSLAALLHGGRCITRVLRYRDRTDAAPDAKPHIDRSLLTVHNWSSHPGLRVLTPHGNVRMVRETSPKSVTLFGGEKLFALSRGVLGFGTPHGVRDERRVHGTRSEDRYAIVSFVHPITRLCDANWLLANRYLIEEYEASITL